MSAEEFQEPQEQQEQSVENMESEQSPNVSPPEPAGEASSPETAHGLAVGSFTAAAFAVVAIFIAWGLLEAFHPVFDVPPELMADNPSLQQSAELAAAELQVNLYNSVLVLGIFAALLAGAMALGEGWARGSWKIAIAGGIGCLLAGAVFGGLAGWVGHNVYQFAKMPGEMTIDLAGSVVVQMTMLAALGAGVGLALGSLAGEAGTIFTRITAGALAGMLAGLLSPFATANLLPAAQTEHLIPRGDAAVLLWLGITGVLLGLIVPGMKIRRKKPAAAPAVDNLAIADGPAAD
ncbi:MAG: hypothetical protein GXY83_40020 [Rhodopirellula sp.]|nr:hypothetical protein [Rhodopirellula sp.]